MGRQLPVRRPQAVHVAASPVSCAFPAARIVFFHSQSEIEFYRWLFPAAAEKFLPLRFTIEPLAPPEAPA